MPGLSKKETRELLDSLKKQKVVAVRKTKGYQLRFPDGGTEMLHLTDSDWRSALNLRARIKSHGVAWPFDGKAFGSGKPLGDWTKSGFRPESVKAVEDAMFRLSSRTGQVGYMVQELADESGVTSPTVQKFLIQRGYERITTRGPYFPPEAVTAPEPPKPAPPVVKEPVKEPVAVPPVVAEPDRPALAKALADNPNPNLERLMKDEPKGSSDDEAIAALRAKLAEPVKPEREFLDTHDSWTVDMRAGNQFGMSLGDYLRVLKSAGLEVEIRVWRKEVTSD